MNGFTVIDNKTGNYPDCEDIALNEEWAKNLCYCDIDSFAITECGSLILVDDCGNCAYCPEGRFTVVTDNNVGSKWIPVMERLPDVAIRHNSRWEKSTESVRVLCVCKQKSGKRMVKEGCCKVYANGIVYWAIPGAIDSVTHWMPLPEPPKGE